MKPEPSPELIAWARETMTAMLNSPFSDPDPNAMPALVLARAVMERDATLLAERDADIARLRKALAVYACECGNPDLCRALDREDCGWHAQETLGGVAARRQALGGRDDG